MPHLRTVALPLATAILTATTGAQVKVSVHAHTQLVAGTKSIAANTDITSGASLIVSGGRPCYSGASLLVRVSGTSVTFGCSSSSYCASAPGAGGRIRIRVTASQQTAGFLVVGGDCPGSRSGFSVDVSNDGSQEIAAFSQFRGPRVLEIPLVVGPTGADIIVRCEAFLLPVTSSVASASVTAQFVAGTSTRHLRAIGRACGPELTAWYAQTQPFGPARSFTLDASNLTQTSSWFVFGLQQQSIVIPPTGCSLYTDVVMPIWVVPSAGRARLSFQVPRAVGSGHAYVQFVQATLRNNVMHWTTSQALQLRL